MIRPLVKVCGITNIEDARISLNAGADMLGFVFFEKSPRYIDPHRSGQIIKELKIDFDFKAVAVVVNPEKNYIDLILNAANIDLLQFHGEEPLTFIRSFNKKKIKALRIKDESDLSKCDVYKSLDFILLDTFSKESYGGTGKVFDWRWLKDFEYREKMFLSGGINSENIEEALSFVKPYTVDLSSGLEKEPGIKSKKKIEDFFSLLAKLTVQI